MMHLFRALAVAAILTWPLVPVLALAEDDVPTEREVMESEGVPPLIPHRVTDTATAKECLSCHETGKKGASVTSHPERKACTQCHVQGEVKPAKPKKGKK